MKKLLSRGDAYTVYISSDLQSAIKFSMMFKLLVLLEAADKFNLLCLEKLSSLKNIEHFAEGSGQKVTPQVLNA